MVFCNLKKIIDDKSATNIFILKGELIAFQLSARRNLFDATALYTGEKNSAHDINKLR